MGGDARPHDAKDADGRPALVHEEHVWNLALGSNMDVEKLKTRHPRGCRPIAPLVAGVPATVPGWTLAFDLLAMPPIEPAMAAAVANPAAGAGGGGGSGVLHGILYKLTTEDYCTLSISEGCCNRAGVGNASSSYMEVVVEVIPYPAHSLVQNGLIPTRVYATVFALRKPPTVPLITRNLYPSQRYLNLLIKGAKDANLDSVYLEHLKAHPVARPVEGRMRGLARFFYIGYFPMTSRKWLTAFARLVFRSAICYIYVRRERAHLARQSALEWLWHAVFVLYMIPLACFGFLKALATGRPVLRIARGLPE
jgi:hypothetical protein